MKTRMWAWAAAAAIVCFAPPAGAQNAPPEFHIGMVSSLTGPFNGPAKDTMEGFDAWVKTHGLPGKKIVLDVLDDETNPVSASNAFRKLASDPKTNIIFLNINSSSALAAKAFASEFKVPIVTGGGADALGFPPDPWMFKVAPSGHDAMTIVLEYMQKKGMKKIAHLYGTDAYGQYDDKAIKDLAPKYGVTLVAAESFAIDDTNFNAQLTRIRAANPDLIYSSAAGRAAILVFKQFKQFGITAPLVVSQAAPTAPFYEAIGGTQGGRRFAGADPARHLRRQGRGRYRAALCRRAEGAWPHADVLYDLRVRCRPDHGGRGEELGRLAGRASATRSRSSRTCPP